MATRKKRTTRKSKVNKSRMLDDIETAKPDEFCYFIDNFKKIWWGQIQKVFTENEKILFQIMEDKESKYYIVPAEKCAFSEKKIKEIKSGK